MQNNDDEYSKAFNNDSNVSDEAAEGATESPAVAMVIDAEGAVEDAAEAKGIDVPDEAMPDEGAEGMVDAPTDMMAAESAPMDGEAISPEDMQRQKSWEGRLRKREEELAAREAELQSAPMAEAGPDDAAIEEIRSRLSEDFGEEFITMISTLASHEAKKFAEKGIAESIGGIGSTIDRLISDTQEAFQSMHYESIADAHEDFMDVAGSPEFQAWVSSMPDDQRSKAEQTIDGGSAGQVIKLLSEYKDHCKAKEGGEADDADFAMDAASGVRSSSPVRLPGRAPANADDEYKAAWSQM
jgi:hypothetical protein